MPIGVVLSRVAGGVSLLDASVAIPFAVVLGAAAIVIARRSRREIAFSLGRLGGARAGRVGQVAGVASLCLAATAGIALGFYGLLVLLGK